MAVTTALGGELALFRRVALAFLAGTSTTYIAVVAIVIGTLGLRRVPATRARRSVIDLRGSQQRPSATVGHVATH